jgi:hypothetical protein
MIFGHQNNTPNATDGNDGVASAPLVTPDPGTTPPSDSIFNPPAADDSTPALDQPAPGTDATEPTPESTALTDESHVEPAKTPEPTPEPVPSPEPAVAAPDVAPLPAEHADDLLSLKQQALSQLTPLVDHLEQSPEEKFRTTMMMIQSTDNQSLLREAYTAAQAITDEKARAQALLDVINEINYFTQAKK